MADMKTTIDWFKQRQGKVTYSMAYRMGPNSYDCSSAVFYALIAGGFLPKGTFIGNTESLFQLEGDLFTQITRKQVRRGDIFVAGYKGGSGGSAGHTGIFTANNRIIHCNYYDNGISETVANGRMGDGAGLPVICYRIKGMASVQSPNRGYQGQPVAQAVYKPNWSINIVNGDGKHIGHYLKHGTWWKVTGGSQHGFQVGRNQFLPFKYSNQSIISIEYVEGYGINAFDKNHKQVIGSNLVLKNGTRWKVIDAYVYKGQIFYGVGRGWYVPQKYTQFG